MRSARALVLYIAAATSLACLAPVLASCALRIDHHFAWLAPMAAYFLAPAVSAVVLIRNWRTLSPVFRVISIGNFVLTPALLWAFTPLYFEYPRSVQSLREKGEPVFEQITAYHASHGRYPPDLASASIDLPHACYGGFQYDVSIDGQSYSLTVGEYAIDGFIVGWENGAWFEDG